MVMGLSSQLRGTIFALKVYKGPAATPVVVPPADAVFPLKTSIVATTGATALSFTRATVDNVVDFEDFLRPVLAGEIPFANARRVRNLLATTSEAFDNAAWTKTNSTITTGIADPLGGSTAYTLTSTAANGFMSNDTASGAVSGDLCVGSIWIRRRTGTGIIHGRCGSSSNVVLTASVTGSWQRLAFGTSANSTTVSYRINLATSGDEVDVWHAQSENTMGAAIQAPSEYTSVGVLSTPYHGAVVDGVAYSDKANGNTVASLVVTEAVGASLADTDASPIGYHCEPSSTNICKRSDQADDATWVKVNVNVAANSVASPVNGSLIADTLTASAGNGTCLQTLGVLPSVAYTFSVYMRRLTGTGDIDLTLDGGLTWTTKAITASWARYDITQTVANPICGFRIVTNADAIYVSAMMVETRDFPTRYIATLAVNVTRNADALTVPDTVYSDTAGTVSCKVMQTYQASANAQQLFDSQLKINAATISANDGTNAPTCTVGLTTRKTVSNAWGAATQRLAATGATAGTGSYDGGWNGTGTTPIGRSASDTATASLIMSNLQVWTSKLTSAQQDLLVT